MAKKVKVVIIAYGDRGSIYANYASTHKDEAEIVAVVDMLEYRLKEASEKFGIPKQNLFTSIEDLAARGKVGKSILETLQDHGVLNGLPESDQLQLF